MSDMHRLIYLSAARTEMTQGQLDLILQVARTNNVSAGVTGLLLFHDGSFFQVLEGPKNSVLRIFSAIERDPRHSRVIVLQTTSCTARAFPEWSMGYLHAHALRPDQQAHLVDLSVFVDREQSVALTATASVDLHINAFLASFREFAPR